MGKSQLNYNDKLYIQDLLNKSSLMADYINTTNSVTVFWYAIDSVSKLLIELSKFEKYGIFKNSTPSKDYKIMYRNIGKTEIKFLNRAYSNSNNHTDFFNELDKYRHRFSRTALAHIAYLKDYAYPHIEYLKKRHTLYETFIDFLKMDKSQIENDVYISNVSYIPRYYIIRGIKYDIDSVKDINLLPSDVDTTFKWNSKEYGLDSILLIQLESCKQKGIQALQDACYDKLIELSNNSIIHENIDIDQYSYLKQIINNKKKGAWNSNLNYSDISQYNEKPFDLNKDIFSEENWSYIMLNGTNLEIAYSCLTNINNLITDFLDLIILDTPLPTRIDPSINKILNDRPLSCLRLVPYTATKRNSKHPFYLVLNAFGDSECCYNYLIYFTQSGVIGKCDLTLSGKRGNQFSYQIQIRKRKESLYVRRIDKTIYYEPYGTTTLYYDET